MNRYLDGRQLDDVAIERLKQFEPKPEGYWLAFSGGKDSCVILDLAKRSGVKFEAHHSLTTCDPPELVRFVKTFDEVQIDRPPKTMWRLIREKRYMPTRHRRWCCEKLKHRAPAGRRVLTGVRREESGQRGGAKVVDQCYSMPSVTFVQPIVDWLTLDVWQYIRERGLRYCTLYDPPDSLSRLGCVLCPMQRGPIRAREAVRWPRIAEAWRLACFDVWASKPTLHGAFPTPETYWEWWLDGYERFPEEDDDAPVLPYPEEEGDDAPFLFT